MTQGESGEEAQSLPCDAIVSSPDVSSSAQADDPVIAVFFRGY
jgi:hypothetical protein